MGEPQTTQDAARSRDVKAIEAILADLTDAWNSTDAQAFTARFTADGNFTNAFGVLFRGRQAFTQDTASLFRGFGKDSDSSVSLKNLRFIRPDVAIAEVDVEAIGHVSLPPGMRAAADGTLRGVLQLVFVREKDGWWITAFQYVPVVPQIPRA